MKERPILFSGPMVRAILDGLKTQTRRAVKLRDSQLHVGSKYLHGGAAKVALGNGVGSIAEWREQSGQFFALNGYTTVANVDCPYGQPGDRLWVRETFQIVSNYHVDCRDNKPPFDDGRPLLQINDPVYPYWEQCYYAATDTCPELISVDTDEIEQKWRPSIHMPRWASRITLEVTGVRVERLQDIKADDAIAEGLKGITKDGKLVKYGIQDDDGYPGTDNNGWPWDQWRISPEDAYQRLWESINGPGSWDANPWVWVVEFRRIK